VQSTQSLESHPLLPERFVHSSPFTIVKISEMSSLDWRRMPVIVSPVQISDRCARKLVDGHIVQAGHIDCVKVPPSRRITDHKWPHSAVLAKEVLVGFLVEQIFCQLSKACQQTKRFGFHDGGPESALCADGTNCIAAFLR
jgi:hypothetical protein